jgi:CBS domain containing-hemolysin-like protein
VESTKHDVKIQYKKIVIVTDSKKHPIGIVSLKDMIKFETPQTYKTTEKGLNLLKMNDEIEKLLHTSVNQER